MVQSITTIETYNLGASEDARTEGLRAARSISIIIIVIIMMIIIIMNSSSSSSSSSSSNYNVVVRRLNALWTPEEYCVIYIYI